MFRGKTWEPSMRKLKRQKGEKENQRKVQEKQPPLLLIDCAIYFNYNCIR